MTISGDLVLGLVAALLGFINLWFWYDKNRDADDRKVMWEELTKLRHENREFMTRPQVREMLIEAITPVKEEQIKTNGIMRSIESILRKMETEFAVTKYALFSRGTGDDTKDSNN